MTPNFEFRAIQVDVKVYMDRILLTHKGLQGAVNGEPETIEILFHSINAVAIQEGTIFLNGYIHLETFDEDQMPKGYFALTGHPRTFLFKMKHNSKAREIKSFIDAQIALAQSPAASEPPPLDKPSPLPSNIDHFEEYRRLTEARDWDGIFKFNNTVIDSVGTKKELHVLADYLEEGEVVFALVSGLMSQTATSNSSDFGFNTWIGALTNERVLFLDHAMFSRSVDSQSIRHDRIQAVSSSQGWMYGKVAVDIGSRSVILDNCEKKHASVFARIANNWLANYRDSKIGNPPSLSNPTEELVSLAKLKEAGVLDEEEFNAAKKKILSRM